MSESRLSCQGVKAVHCGKWQVSYTRKDGRRGIDPYLWDSDEAAHARVNEYMDAGCSSGGWEQLYKHPDGWVVPFDKLPAGSFFVHTDEARGGPSLNCILPDGSPTYLPLVRGVATDPHRWGWDGNVDSPTVQPSILYKGRWHGFFQQGYFQSC